MRTLVDAFRKAAASGRPDLLRWKAGAWREIPASTFDSRVRSISAGLAAEGVGRGDRVAILSENRPEWSMADFAAVCRGAVTVPIYTTYRAPQVAELLADSGAVAAFAGRAEDLEKLLAARSACPALRRIVSMGDEGAGPGVTTLSALETAGRARRAADPQEFDREADAVRPDDLATLIYTSGTTGEPKGAMLTHGNFASDVEAALHSLPLRESDVALSFLPLAHVFERMLEYSYFARGVPIAYVDSIDRLSEALREVRPTIFGAVPRVYEKVRERVLESVEGSALKHALFRAALAAGKAVVARREAGRRVPPLLALRHRLFDALVFSKVRSRLGGRFRFSVSGGAPLGKRTAEFFWAAGIPVFEGYGLTETSPVISVNHFDAWRLGSVGRVVPGVEVAFAPDGELRVRGPIVMRGYWGRPEATAEVLDSDGWFSTGDVGTLDADGFLFITDRKKEILVNAYGKNIAPAPVEAGLAASPYVASAFAVGDGRPFLSALLVPRFDRLEAWARAEGVAFGTREELIAAGPVQALFREEIARWNAGQPSERQVRRFALLPRELTLEAGELTPTLKIKRRVVSEEFAAEIEAMYASAPPAAAGDAGGRERGTMGSGGLET